MDPTSSPRFGDLLRRYRLAAGLTQEELAERAQVSPRAISDLERGARNRPWRETTQLLATALKLDAAERSQPSWLRNLATVWASFPLSRWRTRASSRRRLPRPWGCEKLSGGRLGRA